MREYNHNFIPLFCLGVILSFLIPYKVPILVIFILLILLLFLSGFYAKLRYLLFFLIGVTYTLYSFEQIKRLDFHYPQFYQNTKILVLGEIKETGNKKSFYAKILDKKLPLKKIFVVDYLNQDWQIGQRWEVNLKLKPAIGMVNNVGFNEEYWALSHSVGALASLGKYRKLIPHKYSIIEKIFIKWQQLRSKTKDRIYHQALYKYKDSASIICALVLGDTSGISSMNMEIFNKLGLIHLISISGLHIGMVAGFVSFILYLLFKLLIFFKINLIPNNLKIFLVSFSCLSAVIYSLFAGFSVSAQRSIFMLVILGIAICTRSYTNMFQIWIVALFGVLLYNPQAVLMPGLWLSFLLVAILIFSSYGFLNINNNFKIINFFKYQVAITLISIVLIGFFFSTLPILSPIVNLVTIPWFSLIITPLSLTSIILPWDFLLNFVIKLSQITLNILQFVSNYSYYLPINKVPVIFIGLTIIAVLVLILPVGIGLRLWSITIIYCFISFPKSNIKNGNVKINVLDVGQGQSLLIQTSKHNILYDTGKLLVAKNVLANLNYLGVRKLDMLILSDNNDASDGGFDYIYDNIKINQIFAGQPYRYIQNNVLYCKDELTWQWDNVYFEFLTPNLITRKNNDVSCVLRIITKDEAVIIPGNLSIKGENALINKYGNLLYSQILFLGSHGGNKSSSVSFLDYVEPKYAILSSGVNNVYNNPSKLLIDNLMKRKIVLFRTDLQGQIEIDIGSHDIKLKKVKAIKKFWQQKPD